MKQILFISSFVVSILLLPNSMGFIDYPKINVFLLASQSNMVGKGGVVQNVWDGYVPPECDPNPAILRLNKLLSWEEAREPLHRDIDYENVLRHDTTEEGPGYWRRGHCLYNQFLARAEAAVLRGCIIRAMLWYQGESDTATPQNAIMYKILLDRIGSTLTISPTSDRIYSHTFCTTPPLPPMLLWPASRKTLILG
ncbi:hypothetical protein OROMI_027177 [Orobanche minor]